MIKPPGLPIMFRLFRTKDVTGVSGVGVVAQGFIASDGQVAMRWVTKTKSWAFYSSIDDVIAIHGHHGRTELQWGFFAAGVSGEPTGEETMS